LPHPHQHPRLCSHRTIIRSRPRYTDLYRPQRDRLYPKRPAPGPTASADKNRNTYLLVLPKQAHGVETYTSTTDTTVVKYTAT
ncbi:hypothetical protein ACP2ZX_28635, partial [Klebsiella pneumoniae subsp. pneumoniae]